MLPACNHEALALACDWTSLPFLVERRNQALAQYLEDICRHCSSLTDPEGQAEAEGFSMKNVEMLEPADSCLSCSMPDSDNIGDESLQDLSMKTQVESVGCRH